MHAGGCRAAGERVVLVGPALRRDFRLPAMNAPSFLQLPIRLRHDAPGFFEGLASLGLLYLRAKNPTAELVVMGDSGEAALTSAERVLFPSLGLALAPSRLAGVHASRTAWLPQNPGLLEFDFEQARFPLGIAIADEPEGIARLQNLVATFCREEVELPQLLEWRAALAEPFKSCPCCQAAAIERRAHPEAHPLSPILSDVIDSGADLHCRVRGEGFNLSRFIDARWISFEGGITVHGGPGESILRIDPAHAHAVWVLPVRVDGETRTTVRIYDTLGSMNLELSVPGGSFVAPWQRYCAAGSSPSSDAAD